MLVLSDLDGVIVDSYSYVAEHIIARLNWEMYFSKTLEFPEIPSMITLLDTLLRDGHDIIFMTSRPERNRELTHQWLEAHLGPVSSNGLWMRKNGDDRPAYIVKMEWIRNLMPDLIFEDEPVTAKCASNAGYTVLQVLSFRGPDSTDNIPPIEVD